MNESIQCILYSSDIPSILCLLKCTKCLQIWWSPVLYSCNILILIYSISIDGKIIPCVKSLSFLGVILDESLDWKTHIKNISLKVSRGVGIMSKLKYVVPNNVLKLLYNSMILPHLSYCNIIVWGNSYSSHLTKLKLLQKELFGSCHMLSTILQLILYWGKWGFSQSRNWLHLIL